MREKAKMMLGILVVLCLASAGLALIQVDGGTATATTTTGQATGLSASVASLKVDGTNDVAFGVNMTTNAFNAAVTAARGVIWVDGNGGSYTIVASRPGEITNVLWKTSSGSSAIRWGVH